MIVIIVNSSDLL